MIKFSLIFLSIGLALSQEQLKQERFEFENPVDFVYRRHYIESLSSANKVADYGTPAGAKITVAKDNVTVSGDFNLNCDYSISNDIIMNLSSCVYSDPAKPTVLS